MHEFAALTQADRADALVVAARYDLCTPGTLRLMPPEDVTPLIEKDYESMRNMIFGEAPDFDELMLGISQLESEINSPVLEL